MCYKSTQSLLIHSDRYQRFCSFAMYTWHPCYIKLKSIEVSVLRPNISIKTNVLCILVYDYRFLFHTWTLFERIGNAIYILAPHIAKFDCVSSMSSNVCEFNRNIALFHTFNLLLHALICSCLGGTQGIRLICAKLFLYSQLLRGFHFQSQCSNVPSRKLMFIFNIG